LWNIVPEPIRSVLAFFFESGIPKLTDMKSNIAPCRAITIILLFALPAGCMSAFSPTGSTLENAHTSLHFKPGTEPTGFRGIPWGTPVDELSGMKYVQTDEDRLEIYFREGDELQIGRAKVEKIAYQFWKGKFFGVEISAKDLRNCSALRDAVFEMFGSGLKFLPSQKNDFDERYLYQGDTAVVFLSIEQRLEDFGILILFNKKMKQEIRAERKERIKKSF
jgi:hypothetical protein